MLVWTSQHGQLGSRNSFVIRSERGTFQSNACAWIFRVSPRLSVHQPPLLAARCVLDSNPSRHFVSSFRVWESTNFWSALSMACFSRRRRSCSASMSLFFSAFRCRFSAFSSFLLFISCCSIRPPFDWGRSHFTHLTSWVSTPSSSSSPPPSTTPCLHTRRAGSCNCGGGSGASLQGWTLISFGPRGKGVHALAWRELDTLTLADDCAGSCNGSEKGEVWPMVTDLLKLTVDAGFLRPDSPSDADFCRATVLSFCVRRSKLTESGISWGSGVQRPGRRKCKDEQSRPSSRWTFVLLWLCRVRFSSDADPRVCSDPKDIVAMDVSPERSLMSTAPPNGTPLDGKFATCGVSQNREDSASAQLFSTLDSAEDAPVAADNGTTLLRPQPQRKHPKAWPMNDIYTAVQKTHELVKNSNSNSEVTIVMTSTQWRRSREAPILRELLALVLATIVIV